MRVIDGLEFLDLDIDSFQFCDLVCQFVIGKGVVNNSLETVML